MTNKIRNPKFEFRNNFQNTNYQNVIPAKAGNQKNYIDSHFHGNDKFRKFDFVSDLVLRISNLKLRGYTLIELLIFMGMISILLVVLTEVFGQTLDVRRESESLSSVEQDGNFLLNRFMYDIVRASDINIPSAVGATDTTLDITIDSANFVYTLNGGNLELTTGGVTNRLNSINTSISDLNFQRIGNDDGKDTIQFSYTVTSLIQRAGLGPETKSYQSTVGLR